MPLYTYTCEQHGLFKAWNKMEVSDQPQTCPVCTSLAPRALAAPTIGKNDDGFGSFANGAFNSDAGGASDTAGGGHACGPGCCHG